MINENLESLYKSYYGENQKVPCRCGVAYEDEYLSHKPKIVFVLKEPHSDKPEIDIMVGLRRQVQRGLKGQPLERKWAYTWVQAGIWTYAIHNGFKSYPELRKPLFEAQGIQALGMTNLKKSGGGPSAISKKVNKEARDGADLWRRELEAMQPDLIICGSTYQDVIKNLGLEKILLLKTKDETYHYSIWKYNGHTSILLKFWHPGRRGKRQDTLTLLQHLIDALREKETTIMAPS
jgi:hypothetical protein